MRHSTRSLFLSTFIAAGALLSVLPARAAYVQPHIQHPAFGTVKIVVPVTTPNEKVWAFKLHNVANSLEGAKA
jgi:hypothetical protein